VHEMTGVCSNHNRTPTDHLSPPDARSKSKGKETLGLWNSDFDGLPIRLQTNPLTGMHETVGVSSLLLWERVYH